MDNNKTLREINETFGISRRVIQGYGEIGLVFASDKNKYGHLLYDESAQKRIVQIRLYQRLGFQRKCWMHQQQWSGQHWKNKSCI